MSENIEIFARTIKALVSDDRHDFSTRQLAIFLRVYLATESLTIRGLAAELNISKPAVTRGVDRLQNAGLVDRQRDKDDRRSIFVVRTKKGAKFFDEVRDFADGTTKKPTPRKAPKTQEPASAAA